MLPAKSFVKIADHLYLYRLQAFLLQAATPLQHLAFVPTVDDRVLQVNTSVLIVVAHLEQAQQQLLLLP